MPKQSPYWEFVGHQAIGEVFGGTLTNLDKVYHGVATPIQVLIDDPLFAGLGKQFEVGRYHFLGGRKALCQMNRPYWLEEDQGQVMAMKHKVYDIYGVQFHPEGPF